MTIFVDESGFTGNDLLNTDQPHFTLSSVSISNAEAQCLVDKVKKDFQIHGDELKGANLLKTQKGMDAVKYILNNTQGKYALFCGHKSYALCCKFFEYVFEPVLQNNPRPFYANKFHLFIADSLYLFYFQKDKIAYEILTHFTKMIRKGDFDELRPLFLSKAALKIEPVFIDMINFMEGYSGAIIEELEDLKTTPSYGKWTLDLSMNGLWALLRHWAQSHDEMTVICDSSHPLVALAPQLDAMIGEMEKPKFIVHTTGQFAPVFKLKKSIAFEDSKEFAGIQLADIVASSATYALKNKDIDLLTILNEGTIQESLFPTLENVDLTKKQPALNGVVLKELAHRALNGQDPVLGMTAYYKFIDKQYDISPP